MTDEFGRPFVEGVEQGLTIGQLVTDNERLRVAYAGQLGQSGKLIQRTHILEEALRLIRDFGHTKECKHTIVPIYECGCYERSQAEIARDALEEEGESARTNRA